MLQKSTEHIYSILESLPKEAKVIDVGGASAPFKRANTIIDFVPFEAVNFSQAKGPGAIQFNKENYFSHDICGREPWPFKDKQFDFSICSHVLEDIRDPLWVCSEIIRISKAGYLEVPSRLYETAFGLEVKNLAGATHHRWIVDLDSNKSLRFTFKYMHVHSGVLNKNKERYTKENRDMYLCLSWKDTFPFYENWLNSGKEIFEFYLERTMSKKEIWKIYRKIGVRNPILEWMSYLKNTNSFFASLYKKHKQNES
jgi:hypothetical protein